jgi:hypothetical protein
MSPVPNPNGQNSLNGPCDGSQGVKQSTHAQDLAKNPFHRVWRGNREGTVTLTGVPTFESKYDEREWIKVKCISHVLRRT